MWLEDVLGAAEGALNPGDVERFNDIRLRLSKRPNVIAEAAAIAITAQSERGLVQGLIGKLSQRLLKKTQRSLFCEYQAGAR